MGLNRAIQGARYTGQLITWTREDGTPLNLTGATITGTIQDKNGNTTPITGTLSLSAPSSGIFSWAYSAADIATPGRYLVQFKATFNTYELSFPEVFIVEAAL